MRFIHKCVLTELLFLVDACGICGQMCSISIHFRASLCGYHSETMATRKKVNIVNIVLQDTSVEGFD